MSETQRKSSSDILTTHCDQMSCIRGSVIIRYVNSNLKDFTTSTLTNATNIALPSRAPNIPRVPHIVPCCKFRALHMLRQSIALTWKREARYSTSRLVVDSRTSPVAVDMSSTARQAERAAGRPDTLMLSTALLLIHTSSEVDRE